MDLQLGTSATASLTWQLSLQYIGGMFVLVSLVVFLAMAMGRKRDYPQAFLAVWMLSIPIAAAWLGCGLFFGLSTIYHYPISLAALAGAALAARLGKRAWYPYWRRLEDQRYERRRDADLEKLTN